MSRRESLVGGEVVAEDVAEQAEKKRKQDEQRAHARSRRRRRGSGHGKAGAAKGAMQGSETPAEERRVKTEKPGAAVLHRLPRTGGTSRRRSGGALLTMRCSQNLRRYTRTRAALKAVVDAVNIYATHSFR